MAEFYDYVSNGDGIAVQTTRTSKAEHAMKRLIPLVLLVFALAPSFVMGEGAWFYWNDFSGGLDVRTTQVDNPGNSMIVLQNAVTIDKHLEKCGLFSQISNTFSPNPVRALTSYFNDATQKRYLVAVAGDAGYVSEDGGYTFNMFFHTSGVTVTNGSKVVLFSDSGFVRRYRDMYFSGWVIKLPNGTYSVNRFGVSTNTAVDTVHLEISYSGTTAADTCHYELSPVIGGDHVDFTEWHHNLYIADGTNPIKVWNGTTFRSQDTIAISEDTVSSFRIDSVHTEACEYGIRWHFYIDQSFSHPTDDQVYQYGFSNYRIDWSDNDSAGVGDNFLYSKPTPMAYGYGNPLHYFAVEGMLDTAFGDLNGGVPRNVRKDSVVYIYKPSLQSDYVIIDSGSFEAITKIDSTASFYSPYPIVQRLYDFTDSQKTWSATEHNYNATYLTFVRPDSMGWRRYVFRCVNRVSSPAGTALRVQMTVNPRSTAYHNKWVADYATLPQRYWIVKDVGTITNSENMPSAAFVREQANVLWTAGFSDAPRQVWVSEPGTDSIFGDFIFDVHGERSDQINGIFDIQNYVIFAMGSGITQINGNTNETFGQSPLVYGYGVKGANSMFQFLSNFIGYGDRGFSLFGSGDPQEISAPIYPILRDSLNRAAIPKISGIDMRKGVLVSIPITTSTENNRTYWMNTTSGAWTQWTGIKAASFRVWSSPEGIDTLRIGSSDSGVVLSYKADYTNTVDLVVQTPFLTAGELTAEKQMQQYYVEAAFDYGDKMQVSFYADNNLATVVWTDTITSATPALRSAMYVRDAKAVVYGQSISMKVRSIATDTAVVKAIGMMLAPAREMRNK
jgi:hypothetical protein